MSLGNKARESLGVLKFAKCHSESPASAGDSERLRTSVGVSLPVSALTQFGMPPPAPGWRRTTSTYGRNFKLNSKLPVVLIFVTT